MSETFTYYNNSDVRDYVVKYGLDKDDFENVFFNCEYYETRNSWGHRGEVRIPTQMSGIIKKKIRYYNRTWEEYTYQTLLFHLLEKYATYLTDINYRKVLLLNDDDLKDFLNESKKKFLDEHKYFTPSEYTETKKHYKRIGVIKDDEVKKVIR